MNLYFKLSNQCTVFVTQVKNTKKKIKLQQKNNCIFIVIKATRKDIYIDSPVQNSSQVNEKKNQVKEVRIQKCKQFSTDHYA